MGKPLYLGWRDEFSQDGGFIIDEQHHGVLASINSLHYFLQQGHGLEALLPTAKIVLQYLQFHAKTEEGILRDAEYKDIEQFVEQAEQDVVAYKKACREAISYKDPQYLLTFLRGWWSRHLDDHKNFSAYLSD
ncbi:MAG: chemotaxis protein [Piscirickettsiaceae bacterium]|jgi:hemerythrin|nr:chemotaxis protein [Piscirickettsiaceae bacterium]